MAMTVLVTRNVPDRFRGFLASCMCEIAPGVYTSPRMTPAVRERVWKVMEEWWEDPDEDQGVVMTWPDKNLPGGQEVRVLGSSKKELVKHNGVFLARRELSEAEVRSLKSKQKGVEGEIGVS